MRNLAVLPPIKRNARMALLNLPTFHDMGTDELIAMARALPAGQKTSDRIVA
jgi:tripartite-type tricarboxylate transporter receptor subunit TctC